MDQFIGVYEDAFSKQYCDRVVNYFNSMQTHGFTQNRLRNTELQKTKIDDDFFLGHGEQEINFPVGDIYTEFNSIFWNIYNQLYAANFAILNESGAHNNYSFKIQKTPVGGGYHVWHYESSDRVNCNRLLAWMVYLNDVEEGGETEFLYQHLRLKPKQGTLVIWPAAFTHTHRGNPPLSNEKYVITGWTEF